jgi:glycosyltransferase involved in cell wall biosynthesis
MRTDRIPAASVILPVFGNEKFLPESIDSILTQTFSDFELIIIADSPSDDLKKILNFYLKMDERITIIYRNERGLISALNLGCRLAKGKYIVRMDADDISTIDRFEKQIKFMEENREIGVLGSFIEHIDEDGKVMGQYKLPTDPKIIRFQLFYDCCVAHPSVIMRRSVVESVGFYNPDAESDEDTDLWIKISQISSIANFPEILLKYRLHNTNISRKSLTPDQDQVRLKIRISLYRKILKKEFSDDEKSVILAWIKKSRIPDKKEMEYLYGLITRLSRSYIQNTTLDANQLREIKKIFGLKLFELVKLYKKIDVACVNVLFSGVLLNPLYGFSIIGSRIKFIHNYIRKHCLL